MYWQLKFCKQLNYKTMARKKFNPEEIDDDFLISTIQNEKQVTEKKEEKTVRMPKVKKNETASDYLPLFIRQSDGKARFGKHVPIRQEYHERIQKIVRVIGNIALRLNIIVS